jgi:4-alpha-glucanotransferase
LYEGFVQGEHPLHADFSSFRHAGGEALENHCRFEAIQEVRAARAKASTGASGPSTGATRAAPPWPSSPKKTPAASVSSPSANG